MTKRIVSLVLFFLATSSIYAQKVDNQLWLNYVVGVKMNQRFTLGGDIGLRGLISNRDWNQFLVRPTVTVQLSPVLKASGATALFSTYNQFDNNLHEFRMHQDVTLKWPQFRDFNLIARVRLEERWFFYRNISNEYNTRFRFLIGAQSRDFDWFNKPIYFEVLYERFRTIKNNAPEIYVNQARLHISIGQRVSPKFRYEIHYISQRSREFFDEGLQVSQNIFRFRFFHTIVPKSKE